ncbi:hypothetical protein C8J56DRAFT_1052811 [Mycena floridula]|nr:hypothetical protein C8J56DRAFT_1052811 [Mycena floridula]
MSLRFQSVFVSTLSFASTRLGVAPQLRMPLERRIRSWSHQIQRRIQQWIELDDLYLETILSLSVLNQGPSDSAMISACGVSDALDKDSATDSSGQQVSRRPPNDLNG